MRLILEEDQTFNVKTMSVVESPLHENISNVSPPLDTTPLPMPVKESTNSKIHLVKKNEESSDDFERTNGISDIPLEEENGMIKEKESSHNIVVTGGKTDISDKEKQDTENIYNDTSNKHQQGITETENGNCESCENVNTETSSCEIMSTKLIFEPIAKNVEHDVDFSDENDAEESFEIKLDSSFEDLEDDACEETENMYNSEHYNVEMDQIESTNDQSENLDELTLDITKKSEDTVEKPEDMVRESGYVFKKTEDVDDKTEDVTDKIEDIVMKKEGIIDKKENVEETKDFFEKTKEIVEKTKEIVERTKDIDEKTEDITLNTKNIDNKTVDIVENTETRSVKTNSIDEQVEKSYITTIYEPDTLKETDFVNSTQYITKSNSKNNVLSLKMPEKTRKLDNTEPSKQNETGVELPDSEVVKEPAIEVIDTEKTTDKEELTADCLVSEAIKEKVVESIDTEKEDYEAIKVSSTDINETGKKTLDEVTLMEECNTGIEDSEVISFDASKLDAKTESKTPMEIDAGFNEAVSSENTEGNEKQKDTENVKAFKGNSQSSSSDVEIMEVDNDEFTPKNNEDAKKTAETQDPVKKKKRDSRINLDIFSDEEDDETESKKEDPTTEIKPMMNTQPNVDTEPNVDVKLNVDTPFKLDPSKECVSLDDDDDDDDIMVIDDEAASKSDKESEENKVQDKIEESEKTQEIADKPESDNVTVIATDCDDKEKTKAQVETQLETQKKIDRPLAASDFIDNFKTKISEMTRTDLEEFCLLKIVEGVVDRSNLSEIKDKLKQLMLNVEEWRKKTMVLNKQNRDLQIVLRTVQEEQKKRSDEMITPLKITRSVGMQVLIGDGKADPLNRLRPNQKRPASIPAQPQRTPPPPPPPPPAKPEPKTSKPSPIPVPRLVPAQSPTKPGPSKPSPLQNATVTSNTKNGMKTMAKGAEKRPLSDTVDLTDDEPVPPSKRPPPVRLVPSNQLLAPRGPLVNKTGSPRQVYIPIGQQANIRPGQKIAFKSPNSGPSPRGRIPDISVMRTATPRAVVPRGPNKHPAPLPQAYQQPQPPNWKALPPAPDLKISKIENGIVVSWKIDGYQEDSYEEIVSYQLYAYQETSQPASTFLWNKIGDIKALPLPMACTLTQFIAGYKYYFAVRAVDVRSRLGPFSLPGSILLLNK